MYISQWYACGFFTRTTGLTNVAKSHPGKAWQGCEDSPHPAGMRMLLSGNNPGLRSQCSLNPGLIYFHASGVRKKGQSPVN
jgi:hypothetical protein